MKTAVRLEPIAHLQRAKLDLLQTETRHESLGIVPLFHTWFLILPYPMDSVCKT